MLFNTPITYRKRNGETHTLAEFRPLLIDDCSAKTVFAYLLPAPGRIPLWEGEAYESAGDYTQAQAELRIREVVAADPSLALSYKPATPPRPSPFP